MRFTFGVLLSLFTYSAANAAPTLHYELDADTQQIKVIIDGKAQSLEKLTDDSDAAFVSIEQIADWDEDGLPELLYSTTVGNCCPPLHKLVSYSPERGLQVHTLPESWEAPLIARHQLKGMDKAAWVFTFYSNNEGMNTDDFQQTRSRYIIEQGQPKLIETTEDKELAALVELRSHQLTPEQQSGKTFTLLRYDLDHDGKTDELVGELWERWGRLNVRIQWANGTQTDDNYSCKRIGVLASKTQGVQDLVCDNSQRLVWNGNGYSAQPDALHSD